MRFLINVILISLFVVMLALGVYRTYERFNNKDDQNKVATMKLSDGGVESRMTESGLEIGSIPPDFELPTLSGEKITLSELRGKKVILSFWTTWCNPCKVEMPEMEEFYNKHKSEAYLLTVNSSETIDVVKQYLEEREYSFPVVLDEVGSVSNQYKIMSMPTTFFIDGNGVIQNKVVGNMTEEVISEYLNLLD